MKYLNKYRTSLLTSGILYALLAQGVIADEFFKSTEVQLHADTNRQPLDSGIWTTTFEHFSEWQYGDNFFFLDIEGKRDYSTNPETLYFEYAPRFSLDRVLGTKMLPSDYLGEMYATVQYNGSDRNFINRVWLYGISVDLAGQPNFGFSNVHFLIREEETQDTSYQLTLAWGQPFKLGSWDFAFQGFVDFWEDNEKQVFLTEPQLRFSLSNLFGKDSFLSKSFIGTEIEVSKDFFGKGYGWEVNPTIFVTFAF